MAKKRQKEAVEIPGVPKDFGAVLARLDGRVPTPADQLQIADGAKIADILPVTTRISKKGALDIGSGFNQASNPIDTSKLQIGQLVEGKGIYFGVQEITTKGGLTQTFDLYAAPEDLTDAQDEKLVTTYNKAVIALNEKEDWHGHHGECFENSKELEKALVNGTYKGGWFIPTKEILHGRNRNGDEVQSDNLYNHREKMPGGSEFITTDNGSGHARWYWSSTERLVGSSRVYDVDFTDGYDGCDHKGLYLLSTRPVRAELRPS